MLLAVEHLLGEILHLDLDVVVTEGYVEIQPAEKLSPVGRRLLRHHEHDLHAELLAIKRAQDAFVESLPYLERPRLGRLWWRFLIMPEPMIASPPHAIWRGGDGIERPVPATTPPKVDAPARPPGHSGDPPRQDDGKERAP